MPSPTDPFAAWPSRDALWTRTPYLGTQTHVGGTDNRRPLLCILGTVRGYHEQPRNLMFHLDEIVFSRLLEHAELRDKITFDIGCGTGRHWDRIMKLGPAELIGCDISAEMLKRLRQKYPDAKTYHLRGSALRQAYDVISGVLQRLKDSNRETEY